MVGYLGNWWRSVTGAVTTESKGRVCYTGSGSDGIGLYDSKAGVILDGNPEEVLELHFNVRDHGCFGCVQPAEEVVYRVTEGRLPLIPHFGWSKHELVTSRGKVVRVIQTEPRPEYRKYAAGLPQS